ncbi:MAG: hypothetical protein JWN71_1699 [Xanthobacteraceae bacterium]|jgi:hypothetical protein|nr:hypothetical protein [Xanthobacteraceae bacterium]
MTSVAIQTAEPRRRTSELTGVQIAVLFFVLTLLTSIPVWTHPLPPLSDYVNHLSRMHVIAALERDPLLARFYQVNWQIVPNLAMDLIVPVIGRFVNIYLAGQIFTVLIFVNIMSGTLALNRALFGRWSAVPLIAFPLLYNYVFLIGVMNYMFGIGLALWAMAAWVWLRERPWPLRLIVSALFGIALFFCHLFVLGVYGIALLAFELRRMWIHRDQPLARRLIDFCATGLPFIPVIPLLLASPTMRLAAENDWQQRGKIDGLMFVFTVYSDIVAFAMIGIVVTAGVWAVRRGLMRVHPFCWFMLAVGGLVYLILPRVLFSTYLADQRLPIALAFMLIACIDLKLRHQIVRRGFIAVLLILLGVRLIEIDATWSNLSAGTTEFRASIKRIKKGSKIMVAYADRASGDDVKDLGFVHAACIAMIERSALVTTAFTVDGKQVLHVRPEFHDFVDTDDGTPPSVAQLIVAADRPADNMPAFWHNWQNRFDYVYVLFTEDEAPNPDPENLTLVQDGERFQLYRVNSSALAKTASSRGAR